MISSGQHSSCKRLVAGNYDVLINDSPTSSASFKTTLVDFLNHFERQEADLGEYHKQLQSAAAAAAEQAAAVAATDQQNGTDGNIVAATAAAVAATTTITANTCGYINEFKLLKELSRTLKEDKSNLIEGEAEYNQRKNRYKDILPFSHTRVILSCNQQSRVGPIEVDLSEEEQQQNNSPPSWSSSDNYINANYIRGPSGSPRAYIACQGPLACTLDDFWRMIWECNVSVIVMACNEHESGKPKCELYWPDQLDASATYGDVQVTLLRVRQINSDFLIRKFSVKLLEPLPAPASNLGSQQQQQQHCHHPMDGNNNNGNKMQTNEGDTYDCDSNSFKLADVRLPTGPGGPFYRLHSGSGRNQFAGQCATGNGSAIPRHHTLSNGNSSTSNESISTSTDDSTITTSHNHQHHQYHFLHQQQLQLQQQQNNRKVRAERTICQFHYTTWPDHGVPDSVQPILELVRLIREVQPAENRPVLVHCSAGCGRTGTICCIDYVWGLLRSGKLDSSFNLCKLIGEMRQQRMAMVQTLEQYILCHRAVASLFVQQLQMLSLAPPPSRSPSCSTNQDQSSSSIEENTSTTTRLNENDEDDDDEDDDDDEIIHYDEEYEKFEDEEDDLGPVFI